MEGAGPSCPSCELQAADVTCLDDALLRDVLYLAGERSWRAIALTCRRWHSLLFSDPRLWSSFWVWGDSFLFTITRRGKEAYYRHKLALLQRVAPLVTTFKISDWSKLSSGESCEVGASLLPDLLGMLCPAVVADLALNVHPLPVEALQALPRFAASLTALRLNTQRLPPEVAAVLPQLSGLRSLSLRQDAPFEGVLPTILQLSLLSRLELSSSSPLPPLKALTALRGLRQLIVNDGSERRDALQLPLPADFSALGGLELMDVETRQPWQVADAELRHLCLCLTAPALEQLYGTPPDASDRSPYLLLDGGGLRPPWRSPLGSLAALLEALLPSSSAGVAPLRSLHLERFEQLSVDQLYAYPWLAGVQRLSFCSCTSGSGLENGSVEESEALLAALLAQMPGLQMLNLSGWQGSSLPSCVTESATGLTKLVLSWSKLTVFPTSACPPGLVELDLLNMDHLECTSAELEELRQQCPRLRCPRWYDTTFEVSSEDEESWEEEESSEDEQ